MELEDTLLNELRHTETKIQYAIFHRWKLENPSVDYCLLEAQKGRVQVTQMEGG